MSWSRTPRKAGDGVQQIDVAGNELADIWPEYLYDNIGPVLELCGMYLCYRGGGERCFIKVTEEFFNRHALCGLDGCACQTAGKGRDMILQACQFQCNIIRQQVTAS